MASKRRNMFQKNKTQETTENGTCNLPPFCGLLDAFLQELLGDNRLLTLPDVRNFLQLDNRKLTEEKIGPNEKIDLGPTERVCARPSDFEFLHVIGKGSFGKVVLARHKLDGSHYAVKVLSKKLVMNKNEARHIMSERNVLLKNLDHPFLVDLKFCFQTPEKLYFVLDYINGGELFFHLQQERTFPESRCRFYAAEIASALGYLHSRAVIYRDLKPENILLDSTGHVVLTDFGLSKEGLWAYDTTDTFCGTPEYLAPEVICKDSYDKSVDWWCLGAVLYEMLFGLPPFYSPNTEELYRNILTKPLSFRHAISEQARAILLQLLEKDSMLRLGSGYGDFDDVKRHKFFKSIDWDDLLGRRIQPPFKPSVGSVTDTTNIDPSFTRERIGSSVSSWPPLGSPNVGGSAPVDADDAFAGFSYAPSLSDINV
ncbi:hypothetical protein AAG570_007259 [Ranatra chinensis]|uniref:Uncharacterized protein n=1 Tax=Ranatra chinensis TaxID=642074 RepID=A0ABD0YAJ3_9HEMI